MNECCVCYQETNTITNCGHYVCVDCMSNLKMDIIEEEFIIFIKGKKCPLCRLYIMCLMYYNLND